MTKTDGISINELKDLEYEFCSLINFELYIDKNCYYRYQVFLVAKYLKIRLKNNVFEQFFLIFFQIILIKCL